MNQKHSTRHCTIITAYNPNGLPELVRRQEDSFIICADGGFLYARREGLRPHLIIGDFDSAPAGTLPENDPFFEGVPIVHVPSEKDDTDTMLCVKKGLELGMDRFLIAGGIGGRLDHTIANIQSLAYLREHGADAVMADPENRVMVAAPGTLLLEREPGFKFSLFAYSDKCSGVTLRGAKYPLDDALLEQSFPIGVSNEFAEDTVSVTFTEGRLLVIMSSGS